MQLISHMHSMNPPIVRGQMAFASCTCGWIDQVAGVRLEETDRDLNYTIPAENAWIAHMDAEARTRRVKG